MRYESLIGVVLLFVSLGAAPLPPHEKFPGVRVIDAPLRRFEGHRDAVHRVIFSPDGALAASCASDRTIRLWDIKTGKEVHTFRGHLKAIHAICFSPDGRSLASGSEDGIVKIWDIHTGEQTAELDAHNRRVNCVLYHPGNKAILTGSCDTMLRAFDPRTEKLLAWYGNRGCVESIAMSANPHICATGTVGGYVCVFDLSTLKRTLLIHADDKVVSAVAFTHDQRWIISRGQATGIRIWDAKTGQEVKKLGFASRVDDTFSLSPDDRYLALTLHYDVLLVDIATAKPLARFRAGQTVAADAVFSPNGKYILSGGSHGMPSFGLPANSLFLWDVHAALEPSTP